jgi:hypothetical protein
VIPADTRDSSFVIQLQTGDDGVLSTHDTVIYSIFGRVGFDLPQVKLSLLAAFPSVPVGLPSLAVPRIVQAYNS